MNNLVLQWLFIGLAAVSLSFIIDSLKNYLCHMKYGEVIEELASLEHEQWVHWVKYMMLNATEENLSRWLRQVHTSYPSLSEREKEADRKWARKVVEIMERRSLLK